MQIDISAEDACGTARDLRIRAPDGTPWCVVAGTVAAALGESATAPISWWSGEHRLGPKDVVGQGALSSGAILRRQSPPPAEPRALRRVGVVAGAAAGTTFALSSRETTVGRGPDCVVRVDDPAVSRVHLRLTVVSSGVAVTDLGAVNPAHVEGLRVTHEAVLLQPGELLTLGAAALRLVDDPAGIAPPPAIGAADAESAVDPCRGQAPSHRSRRVQRSASSLARR